MCALKIGDLVRWKKPLCVIEHGIEKEIGTWKYALVVNIAQPHRTPGKIGSWNEPRTGIELLVAGSSLNNMGTYLPLDMILDNNKMEKLKEGQWIVVAPI